MVQHYIPVTEKNWNSWALSLTKYNREKIEIDNWNVKKHSQPSQKLSTSPVVIFFPRHLSRTTHSVGPPIICNQFLYTITNQYLQHLQNRSQVKVLSREPLFPIFNSLM